jgi:hypothetical protein
MEVTDTEKHELITIWQKTTAVKTFTVQAQGNNTLAYVAVASVATSKVSSDFHLVEQNLFLAVPVSADIVSV